MGGIVKGVQDQLGGTATGGIGGAPAGLSPQAQMEAKVERLTKLVHILWKEAERLESIVQAAQGGLLIKSGFAEVSVKRDGEVVISGQRIELKSAGDINIKGRSVRINGQTL